MEHSKKIGFSFGLTSGIITTLGLIVGLYSVTNSKLAVIGGILTIAIADSFSDALGIHISEESEAKHTSSEIWQSSISTFISKLIFAVMFIFPFLIFSLTNAVIICILVALLLLGAFSYYLAIIEKSKPSRVISEHLFIAVIVIVLTNYFGNLIHKFFG